MRVRVTAVQYIDSHEQEVHMYFYRSYNTASVREPQYIDALWTFRRYLSMEKMDFVPAVFSLDLSSSQAYPLIPPPPVSQQSYPPILLYLTLLLLSLDYPEFSPTNLFSASLYISLLLLINLHQSNQQDAKRMKPITHWRKI